MFDEKAKEYAENTIENWNYRFSDEIEYKIKQTWQDAAKFGFNKANEWHYPSNGELPKEDTAEKETLYLLWFGLDDSDYMTGLFSHGRFWCFDSGWFETNEVIAWKEIIPPKESE